MKKHWKTCEKLAAALGISKQECNCAYAVWLHNDLIPGILGHDPVACKKALQCNWYGKIKTPICDFVQKTYKDRAEMNDFEKLIDDTKLMAWAVSKIGCVERAQSALNRLK